MAKCLNEPGSQLSRVVLERVTLGAIISRGLKPFANRKRMAKHRDLGPRCAAFVKHGGGVSLVGPAGGTMRCGRCPTGTIK